MKTNASDAFRKGNWEVGLHADKKRKHLPFARIMCRKR